jgi:hypothetical protein
MKGPHLKMVNMIGGVTAEEFDYFHELIAMEETYAIGYPGVSDGKSYNYF